MLAGIDVVVGVPVIVAVSLLLEVIVELGMGDVDVVLVDVAL